MLETSGYSETSSVCCGPGEGQASALFSPSVELCAGLPTSREQKLLRLGLHAPSRALLV